MVEIRILCLQGYWHDVCWNISNRRQNKQCTSPESLPYRSWCMNYVVQVKWCPRPERVTWKCHGFLQFPIFHYKFSPFICLVPTHRHRLHTDCVSLSSLYYYLNRSALFCQSVASPELFTLPPIKSRFTHRPWKTISKVCFRQSVCMCIPYLSVQLLFCFFAKILFGFAFEHYY